MCAHLFVSATHDVHVVLVVEAERAALVRGLPLHLAALKAGQRRPDRLQHARHRLGEHLWERGDRIVFTAFETVLESICVSISRGEKFQHHYCDGVALSGAGSSIGTAFSW